MKHFYQNYKFCPVCGTKYEKNAIGKDNLHLKCNNCDFKLYIPPFPTTSVVIPKNNNPYEIIINTRAKEPKKDLMDLPGGFIDYDETAEECAIREIKEEVGLDIEIEKPIFQHLDIYEFQDSIRTTLNTIYLAKPVGKVELKLQESEISDSKFIDAREIIKQRNLIAFEGEFNGIKKYLEII